MFIVQVLESTMAGATLHTDAAARLNIVFHKSKPTQATIPPITQARNHYRAAT